MRLRALLVLIASVAFAAAPFLTPGFGGYDTETFPVPLSDPSVQPAGYAFSIWGAIYLWLIFSAAHGLWRRAEDPAWDATRLPLLVSLALGTAWLAVALASAPLAAVLIWAMLGAALMALLRAPRAEHPKLRGPIGFYAGWLTAASCVSLGLVAAGWGLPPFGPDGWAFAALALALALAVAVLLRVPSPAYGAAMVWALVAVTVRNGWDAVGIFAALAALGLAALTVRVTLREKMDL